MLMAQNGGWRREALKQTPKINNVEHSNGDNRVIGAVESYHPRKRPNFGD